MGVIYKITSPSGKVYVGKTYNLRKRINAHKDCLKKGKNIILHNSLRKYGWDAHAFEIIEEIEDALLNEREIYWIKELGSYCYENPMGMNMTLGGDGQRGAKMTPELKKWFSNRFKGENGSFYGRKHTEETKRIIAEKTSKRNREEGRVVPKWGAEKGRLIKQKAVVAYFKTGILINEFVSLTECATQLNIKLQAVKDSVCYGSWINGEYLIKYKTENYPSQIDVGRINKRTEKRPVVLLTPDLEIMIEFPSALEASEFLNIPKTTINRAAQYNFCHPIRTGHIFLYRDDYDELFEEAA